MGPKVAVVGLGTMGAQCLWQLSRRGIDASGYETYVPGHGRGAAGGDNRLFRKYAVTPELAALINALVFGSNVAPTTNRTDIAGIFIPDLIKVDLSTGPARLAGGGCLFSDRPHQIRPRDARRQPH